MTYTEKKIDKIKHPVTIKTLSKVGLEETYFNIVKVIYDETIVNIMLNGES